MKNQLSIEMNPLNYLRVPTINVRIHSKSKLRKLKNSVARYGLLVPMLIAHRGQIVDGVARYLAAKAAGLEHIPTVDISHLTEVEIRALRLGLNRLQEEATWDKQAVAIELRSLLDVGFELDLTGFDAVEIENFLEIGEPVADVENLDLALAAKPLVSRPNDIWNMLSEKSYHRLACGDFRDAELCKKLFGEDVAAACFVDPPYNVRVKGHVSGTGKHAEFAVASGEMSDAEFEAFLHEILVIICRHLGIKGVTFVCMDWRHIRHLLNAGERCALELLNLAIWTKSNPGMGSFYRSQHELVAIFKRRGQPHRNNIELGRHGRSRSNVWPYRGGERFRCRATFIGSASHPQAFSVGR